MDDEQATSCRGNLTMSGEAAAHQSASVPLAARDHAPDANAAISRRTIPSRPAKMPSVERAALSPPIIHLATQRGP
jgi:hypothetical protein